MDNYVYNKISSATNRIIGSKQVIFAATCGKLNSVIVASDTDEKLLIRIISICTGANIPIEYVPSKVLLGKACGIDVACAVVGLID